MPFNLSFTHFLVVGIVALVVLGPERLPGVARTAGNLWREWQRIRGGLEGEVREAFSEFREPFNDAFGGINNTVKGVVDDFRHGPADENAPDASEAPPLSVLAPLGGGAPVAVPSLGPSTGLVSPGPTSGAELPVLGPPDPETFVPFPGPEPASR